MTQLFSHPPHLFQPWHNAVFERAGIEVSILRGDLFHPWIQGNKWYKIRHYARQLSVAERPAIVSIGGAWSNHLLALAALSSEQNIPALFFIRGDEKEWNSSPYVEQMRKFGVRLKGISRSKFRLVTSGNIGLSGLSEEFPGAVEVPLGASSPETVACTADWGDYISSQAEFTDLVLPVASGGTLAGMLAGTKENTCVHGIDVLGSRGKLKVAIQNLMDQSGFRQKAALCWHDAYDFGGYARKHPKLEKFIAGLQAQNSIPSEHVYSGKAFYAVSDLAANGHFLKGSKILILHTGGIFQ